MTTNAPATAPCAACGVAPPPGARYCPGCGIPVDVASTPTGTAPRHVATPLATPRPGSGSGPEPGSAASHTPPSGPSIDGARFAPGALVGARYRIVGRIGKGGMGEVYRADDLVLGQPVALKFLPDALRDDAGRLARFYSEVRIARQVSHPAVCRVHDVGELEGVPFLSMEFVDGEDLASLLRRIGRLPSDKALEIARQLSVGLAAAHARGVLHRDLKPHNVMLDSRGAVRLTDFGLAGLAESFVGDEVRSGTPAYMAPEQLAGREVTAASDVYALGLLLFELFTGKRPFAGRSLAELTRQHLHDRPPAPSALVPDLDPGVERVILACLEKDPRQRPPSALSVAAQLPGGDPLAAALAAGETPSRELVAAASGEGRVGWARVALLVGAIAMGALAAPFLTERVYVQRFQPLSTPIPVLEHEARALLSRLGYPEGADSARGFDVDQAYLGWVEKRDSSAERWQSLASGRPAIVQFWYRQSPEALRPRSFSGRVSSRDPRPTAAGMVGLWLDAQGRLLRLEAQPPQVDAEATQAPPPDWDALFRDAGLEPADFVPTAPLWTPPGYADERAAWAGSYAERPELPVRVEAAAYRGRPVYFQVVGEWTRPEREPRAPPSTQELWAYRLVGALLLGIFAASAVLARIHLRRGRGDRQGARRVALYAVGSMLVSFALSASHVPVLFDEMELVVRGAGLALVLSVWIWLLYLAIEPHLRRWTPARLVSWSRLLAGRFDDPRVGRDLLTGMAIGTLLAISLPLVDLAMTGLGMPPPVPWARVPISLEGPRLFLAGLLDRQIGALGMALGFLLLLFLLQLALRRLELAVAALLLLLSIPMALQIEAPLLVALPLAVLFHVPLVAVLLRFGLVAATAALFVHGLLVSQPLSTDLAHWTSEPTLATLAVVAALTLFAARSALGAAAPAPGAPGVVRPG